MNRTAGTDSSLRLAGVGEEIPVFFPVGKESLFGLMGVPAFDPIGVAVVVLPGGWRSTSAGRNRLLVRLCRRLQSEGYHTFRFDYLGVGESTGTRDRFVLGEPSVADLMAAIEWLTSRGVTQFVLVGFCFGAWTSLICTPQIPGMRGVALVAAPVHARVERAYVQVAGRLKLRVLIREALRPWFWRQLASRDRRRHYGKYIRAKWDRLWKWRRAPPLGPQSQQEGEASPEFLEPLRALLARRIPALMLYGTEDFEYGNFKRALSGTLGKVLSVEDSGIEVCTTPGDLHGLAELEVQEKTIEIVTDWLSRQRALERGSSGDRAWTST
jgi:alpha/beta superfamily hydrolase